MLGEVVDAVAILAIVVLNAVIEFSQEFSAEKSIVALKKMTAPLAEVWREAGDPVAARRAAQFPGGGVMKSGTMRAGKWLTRPPA